MDEPYRTVGRFGAPGAERSQANREAAARRHAATPVPSSHQRTGTNESGDLGRLVRESDPLPGETGYRTPVGVASSNRDDDVFSPAFLAPGFSVGATPTRRPSGPPRTPTLMADTPAVSARGHGRGPRPVLRQRQGWLIPQFHPRVPLTRGRVVAALSNCSSAYLARESPGSEDASTADRFGLTQSAMRRRNRSPASRLTANDHSLLASAIPAAPHRGSAPSVPPGATRPSSTRAGGYREGLRPGQRDVSPGRAANRPTGDLDLQFTIPPLPDLDDPASAISPSAALLRHARGESTITSGRGSWSSPRADLENSVMLRDDQAAHQTIRKLRSEVAEEQRRADHYRAEREGLRAALSANQSQLQDLSRKMHALEEANRNLLELTQSLREQQAGATATRGGLPPHAPGTMAPRAHPSHLAPPTFHQGPSMPSASGPPFGTPPFGPPPSTFARARGPVDGRYLTGALPALFDQVETWACQFANLPNHHRDIDLPGGVRQQLTEAVEASVADTFLSRVETRWCLVTRVILQMLMVPIQDLSILKGFQPAVDRRVEQCRSQLFPQMAHHARHHVMMELCAIEKHLKQQPGYEAFWAHKTAEAVEHLFSVVGPLATVNESVNEAKQALEALAREAMRLTSLMSSMPVQWVVEFPRAGAKFTAHSMVNRDHVIGGPTRDLERRNFRVSLAITPSIVMRDVANGALLMSTLSSAHVLLLA